MGSDAAEPGWALSGSLREGCGRGEAGASAPPTADWEGLARPREIHPNLRSGQWPGFGGPARGNREAGSGAGRSAGGGLMSRDTGTRRVNEWGVLGTEDKR